MSKQELARQTDVIELRNMDDLARLADMFAKSGYFRDAKDAAQAGVKILAGRELGFGPFASLNGIHLIQGKPSMGANLMAAAVKGSGRYDFRVRSMTDEKVSIEFFERGDSLGVSTFTSADAKKAGTQNMQKFPRNMLYARAMSNGVKWYCPDVFAGNTVYVPEELGVRVDGDGAPVEDAPASMTVEPEDVPFRVTNDGEPEFPPEDDLPESLEEDAQPDEDEAPAMITTAQLKLLKTKMRGAGFKEEDEREYQFILWLLERGRGMKKGAHLPERTELASSKDLTKAEATYVLGIVSDDDVRDEAVNTWDTKRKQEVAA